MLHVLYHSSPPGEAPPALLPPQPSSVTSDSTTTPSRPQPGTCASAWMLASPALPPPNGLRSASQQLSRLLEALHTHPLLPGAGTSTSYLGRCHHLLGDLAFFHSSLAPALRASPALRPAQITRDLAKPQSLRFSRSSLRFCIFNQLPDKVNVPGPWTTL